MLAPEIIAVAKAIHRAGGRAFVVGGYVRDRLLGIDSKDVDVEVYGLALPALEKVLAGFGEVVAVGRAFGVLRIKGIDVDFSLPRRDSKAGPGHRGFVVRTDPGLDFAQAARRRDVTINSIGLDPLSGEIVDPWDGRTDLERGVLRATDPARFPEDPLRALRVAQFAARFEMRPDNELIAICGPLDLSELSPERVFEEFRKLLLAGRRPSLGLEFLRETGLLRFFPEIAAMVDVPQDPEWHPEGDVWVHTLMVLDAAAKLRRGDAGDLPLMFGALCHDFGKPQTTLIDTGGRVRSPAHDAAGVPVARRFLERNRAPGDLVVQVEALTRHHLAPALYVKNGATAKGYRRLARALEAAGTNMELLVRVARADHLGRATEEALAGIFPAGDRFLARAEELTVSAQGPTDLVLGRHLIARGLEPGPVFGEILARCREIQDETGWDEPERILDAVLASPQQPYRPA